VPASRSSQEDKIESSAAEATGSVLTQQSMKRLHANTHTSTQFRSQTRGGPLTHGTSHPSYTFASFVRIFTLLPNKVGKF
jgi:hypothetical protein